MVSLEDACEEERGEFSCGGFYLSWSGLKIHCECKEKLFTAKVLDVQQEAKLEIETNGKVVYHLKITAAEKEHIKAKRIQELTAYLRDLSASVEIEDLSARSMEFNLEGTFTGNLILNGVNLKDGSSEGGYLAITLPFSGERNVRASVSGRGRGNVILRNSSIDRIELEGNPMNALTSFEIIGGDIGTLHLSAGVEKFIIGPDHPRIDRIAFPHTPRSIELEEGVDAEVPICIGKMVMNSGKVGVIDVSSSVLLKRVEIGPVDMRDAGAIEIDEFRANVVYQRGVPGSQKLLGGFEEMQIRSIVLGRLTVRITNQDISEGSPLRWDLPSRTLMIIEKSIIKNSLLFEECDGCSAPYILILRDLSSSQPEEFKLTLKGLEMGRVSLLECAIRDIDLIDVSWDGCKYKGFDGWKDWFLAQGIFLPDAIQYLRAEERNKSESSQDHLDSRLDERVLETIKEAYANNVKPPFDWVKRLYSQLRDSLEVKYSNYEVSGELFIGEMRLLRYRSSSKSYKLFSFLYDILASYGESLRRPLIWMGILGLGALVISFIWAMISCPLVASCILNILVRTLSSAVVAIFPIISDDKLTYWQGVLRMLGLLLIGLEFVALKRRFERRYRR